MTAGMHTFFFPVIFFLFSGFAPGKPLDTKEPVRGDL
jgi:hypothetical protein